MGVQGAINLVEGGRGGEALAGGLREILQSSLEKVRVMTRMAPAAEAAVGGLIGGDAQTNDIVGVDQAAMGLLADGAWLLAADAVQS